MRKSQRLPGVERSWLPGEQSHNRRIERLARGIPIPPLLRNSFDGLASELNISATFSKSTPFLPRQRRRPAVPAGSFF
jgi:LDH2 family malate/lactate/ureidoglycolate dehydrogenase